MPAYVISEVEARDPVAFEQYRTLAAASIARHGGRYLVRGGEAHLAEGGPVPKTLVIVEFPSMDRLKEWYTSPDYAPALRLSQTGLERRLVFVDGVLPDDHPQGGRREI